MSYKIHIENHKPADFCLGSHIILESEPLRRVETREEAQEELQKLVNKGLTDVYAVGFDE